MAARDRYETRIDRLLNAQSSPTWTVRALARRGSLSYSMLRGLMTLEDRGFVVISPKLHASFVQAQSRLEGFGTAEEAEARFRENFERSETGALVARAIAAYAWAAVIAQRYGVSFGDIGKRLDVLRAQVGADHFAKLVCRAASPAGFAPQYERLVVNDLGVE